MKKLKKLKIGNGASPSMACPQDKVEVEIGSYAPNGFDVSLSFRLVFPCSWNKAEFEALVIWAHLNIVNGGNTTIYPT